MMSKYKIKSGYTVLALSLIGYLSIIFIFAYNLPFNDGSGMMDADLFSKYGSFIGGVFGSIFTLLSVILLFMALTNQKKSSKKQINLLKTEFNDKLKQFEQDRRVQTFFQMINELHHFETNIRVHGSEWEEVYRIKQPQNEFKIEEKNSYSGVENFRKLILPITNLYNGFRENLTTKNLGSININDKKGQVDYIYRIYKDIINQYFKKIRFIISIAKLYDEDSNKSFFKDYFLTCINLSQKFLVAFLYMYDSDFQFKDLIDEYKIINNGDFDGLITHNEVFLKEIYEKTVK